MVLLVIIVVILSGIIIFLVTRSVSTPEVKLISNTVFETVSSTSSSKEQPINILGKYTASIEDSTIKLTKNNKGEVIEISNILGDTPKGLTTLPNGNKIDYQLAPVTISFFNEKQTYPSEDEGWYKQPNTEKISIEGIEYSVTWYSDGEGDFYGGDGILLENDTIANCPQLKSYTLSGGRVNKYFELPNSVYVVISYSEYIDLNNKTCIQKDKSVSDKTLKLVDQILQSMKKI